MPEYYAKGLTDLVRGLQKEEQEKIEQERLAPKISSLIGQVAEAKEKKEVTERATKTDYMNKYFQLRDKGVSAEVAQNQAREMTGYKGKEFVDPDFEDRFSRKYKMQEEKEELGLEKERVGIEKTKTDIGKTQYEIAKIQSDIKETERKAKQIGGDISKETFQREKDLRTEYRKDLGDFPKIRDSFGRVKASAKDPSAAGDLALIFNYMKMLDPGSVVRESEFANAANTGSVPQRIWAKYNKVLEGERLSSKMRSDFLDRSERLFGEMNKMANNVRDVYEKQATEYGLNPDRITIVTGLEDIEEKQEGTDQTIQERETKTIAGVDYEKREDGLWYPIGE